MHTPTPEEFQRGCSAFRSKEQRNAMYKTATFLVAHFWGKPAEIADSLGVLLLTWNQAFYRYGAFDFLRLERTIAANLQRLEVFRNRDIFSYTSTDDASVKLLFDEFLNALQLCEGSKKGTCSPVAVAKALHLLAPRFFPLWDLRIANAYGCRYANQPAEKYVLFMTRMRDLAKQLVAAGVGSGEGEKTLLKRIDEYNYATHTKDWV